MVAAPQQSSRGHSVVATRARWNVPAHRVSQPIVDVEEESDLDSLGHCLLGNSGLQNVLDVTRLEVCVVERHLLEETEGCAKLHVD